MLTILVLAVGLSMNCNYRHLLAHVLIWYYKDSFKRSMCCRLPIVYYSLIQITKINLLLLLYISEVDHSLFTSEARKSWS